MLSLLHVGFVMKVIHTAVQLFFVELLLSALQPPFWSTMQSRSSLDDKLWEYFIRGRNPEIFFFFLSPLLVLQRLCSADSLQVTTPVKMRKKKTQPFPNYVFVYVCVREQEGFAILICIGWASSSSKKTRAQAHSCTRICSEEIKKTAEQAQVQHVTLEISSRSSSETLSTSPKLRPNASCMCVWSIRFVFVTQDCGATLTSWLLMSQYGLSP